MNTKFSTKKLIWWFMIGSFILTGINFVRPTAQAQNEALVYGSSDVPMILPRSTWDNTPSLNALMTWLPQNADYPYDWQPVERIILHDTGCDTSNPTCNNNQNPIATIQGIYRYHAVTQGWGDIGYNYVIDQQGRIYEGRYGGNGSRGAHTYYDRAKDNFNFGSIGIAVLGNYAMTQPPEAVYGSLVRLVGWLCALNSLDPQRQTASFIWNTVLGGFKSFYSGPVVVGHKDVEKGNPDPGSFDFMRIRREAASLAAKYKNYLYRVKGSPKVYRIESGRRTAYEDLATLAVQGGAEDAKVVDIFQTQLDLFSESRFLKYPDGTLVQINAAPMIYLIEESKRRPFELNAAQFLKMDFDFGRVKAVTADEMQNYPLGLAVKYGPDKELLSDGQKVYFMENGKKRWITSGNLFKLLGYKWSKVKLAPLELATYLAGDFLSYPDGTLLRDPDKATIYLIKNAQKHEFLSAQSFLKLKYRWDKVLLAEKEEVALYPPGGFVAYPDGTLVKAENSPIVFVVEKGKIRAFLSEEIFRNLKYKSASVLTVLFSELAYYTQSEPVKYPDKTLLRAKSGVNVYLAANGKLQLIDAATFKKKKYKWSQVLVISDQDFNNLYGPKPVAAVALAPAAPPVSPSATADETGASPAVPPKIRIALFEVATSTLEITASSAFDIFDKKGGVIATKAAGEKFTYVLPTLSSETFVKVLPQTAEGVLEILSYEERPAWKPTLNYNKFRGALEIVYSAKSQKIWAVNELSLEDYLRGVAEATESDPPEYQKTMAVASRTYAYYYLQKGGKHGADEVFHLKKTAGDQLYKGYGREILAPSVAEGVQATRGEIVIFNNQPIVAAYSSGASELQSSGSRSACTVWGSYFCQTGFEYLTGGIKDPAGATYNYSTCSGANHCVGLSGAGTRQFAKTGVKNYQEILKHYYPGVEIIKIY